MKIIALGDTHGRVIWKRITAKNDFDKVIFIGDYFDSKENISPQQQKQNFKDIIAFKKANMSKVILLFGNHDYHYLRTTNDCYSGFQKLEKKDIQELVHQCINQNLFQMCYVYNNILFTHAGVTRTWCRTNSINMNNIEQSINALFKYRPSAFQFTSGINGSASGDDITQSPIWVRSRSLFVDKIPNYIQVVGHTSQDKISFGSRKIYTNGMTIDTGGVIFIDTLGTSGEYLQIVNNQMSILK